MKTSRTQHVALFLGMFCLSGIAGSFAQTRSPRIPQPADAGHSPASYAAGHSAADQASDHAATSEKIIRYVRERFSIPANVKLTVSSFRDSVFADFYETTLTLDDGKQPQSQDFFVSKDGRYLIGGNIYTLGADPKREVMSAISLEDQPSQGPANAPLTIVEYADLQCPMCTRLHEILENDVVPKYGDKIRVVFKDFPLAAIHDWAMTGAIASQCAYQVAPENFVAFRTLVYQNQTTLNADNARDMLLHLGAQAGIDNLKMASCIDGKAAASRIEANLREAQKLGISSTPTSFVNGRVVVGAPPLAELFKILDEALQHAAK